MADDKRQFILDLLARDKTGDGTRSASKNIDDVGDKADKTSKRFLIFGKSSKQASEDADKLGKQASQTGRDMDKLAAEIKIAEAELGSLARAFAETDDAAQRVDLTKSMKKTQAEIKNLSKNKGILSDLIPDPEPNQTQGWARKWGTQASNALKDAASQSMFGTAAAVLGVAMAPEIGGLIAGAVVGGVGLGGIIGGIALAAKDPAVSGWAKRIGSNFKSGISAEAQDAFHGPLMASLADVEALAQRSIPKIGKIFDNVAPSVQGLTKDVGKFGDELLDSLVYASGKSGPVLDAIGKALVTIGGALGSFIEMAADHSKEAGSAITDLATDVSEAITVFSDLVGALSDVKGGLDTLDDHIDKARYSLEDHVSWLDLTADGYKKGSDAAELYRKGIIGAAGSTNDYSHYLAGAAAGTDKLKTAMDDAAKAARGEQDSLDELSKTLKAQTDPVFGLLDASDKLNDAQKAVADSTKQHGKNSEETRAALRQLAEAAIDLEGKAGTLGGTFNGKMTPALKATLQAAGLTTPEIKALGKQFETAKGQGQDFAKNYAASASVNGVPGAISKVKSLKEELASMKVNWTVTIRQNFLTFGKPYSTANPKYGGLATGGSVREGTPTWVGEHGPELLMMDRPARVLSAAGSRGQIQGGGTKGGGGQGGTLRLELAGPEEVKTMFRWLVRTANLLQDA